MSRLAYCTYSRNQPLDSSLSYVKPKVTEGFQGTNSCYCLTQNIKKVEASTSVSQCACLSVPAYLGNIVSSQVLFQAPGCMCGPPRSPQLQKFASLERVLKYLQVFLLNQETNVPAQKAEQRSLEKSATDVWKLKG